MTDDRATQFEEDLTETAEVIYNFKGMTISNIKETIRSFIRSQGLGWAGPFNPPDNEAWHKTPRLYEAYQAGRNEFAGAVKFVPLEMKE